MTTLTCPHCGGTITLTPEEAARLLGAIGGKATSPAKTLANREKANLPPKAGKRPRGRPKTTKTPPD